MEPACCRSAYERAEGAVQQADESLMFEEHTQTSRKQVMALTPTAEYLLKLLTSRYELTDTAAIEVALWELHKKWRSLPMIAPLKSGRR